MDAPSCADVRREYGDARLDATSLTAHPMDQFNTWLLEALQGESKDPNAMVLSTVDAQGHPDARVVLLKGIQESSFVFYTNYESTKALQIKANPFVALTFYWPDAARQVRVLGVASQTTPKESDVYFSSRPIASQYAATISPQSQPIESPDEMIQKFNLMMDSSNNQPISRPQYWGGYAVKAHEIEFWQGRTHRIHDRVRYTLEADVWTKTWLAP